MAALGGSVARRYAKALFQIGVDAGDFDELGRQLEALNELIGGSPELRQALENPIFSASEKRGILEALLPRVAPSAVVQRLVVLLLERRRVGSLAAIARAYRELADEHTGRVRADVTSAQPLSPAELDKVRRSLEQRTGKKVILKASVDRDLIGGLVARVGDLVLDGSVRTQLAAMRDKLLQ